MELIFLFVLFSLVSAIVGGLLYVIVWIPLRTRLKSSNRLSVKQSRRFNIAYIFIFLAIPALVACVALYPGDDFYAGEFKQVTLRDLPSSANIIVAEASYPDLHGDYISKVTIELSKADYQKLKDDLTADTRISKPGENKYPDDYNYLPKKPAHPDAETFFFRQVKGQPDEWLTIEFSSDGKTVYITVAVT